MLPTLFLDRKMFLGQSSRITERLQGPGDTSLVQSDLSKFELWWFLPKEATSANRSVLLIGRNGEEPTRRFGQDAAPDPPVLFSLVTSLKLNLFSGRFRDRQSNRSDFTHQLRYPTIAPDNLEIFFITFDLGHKMNLSCRKFRMPWLDFQVSCFSLSPPPLSFLFQKKLDTSSGHRERLGRSLVK